MKYSYKTKNTCPKEIILELNKGVVTNVQFLDGGCPGNLQALPRLVEGMEAHEVITKLQGINCGIRGTSCADQLAEAVKQALKKEKASN